MPTWAQLTRPAFRDALRVVRRDDRRLQIGLDPPHRLVLDDQPGLYDTLAHLDRRPPDQLQGLVDRLVTDGWIVDLAGRPRPHAAARSVRLRVDVLLDDAVTRAVVAAGLVRSDRADTHLVVTTGEPRRSVSDALVRDDVTHLWLSVHPTGVRVGPFVDPGRTACLRCLDAHLGDRDPRRATVLRQLEDLPHTRAVDPDPHLVQIGAAWAVRDIVRHLDGQTPTLRSATVTVSRDLEVERRDWLRHAHCGCAWGECA